MPLFPCPSCAKKLKVDDRLAGKRVRCPGCGSAVLVPEPEMSPPRSQPGIGEQPTPSVEISDQPTNPPLTNPDQTIDSARAGVDDDTSKLIEILAPAQAADELGRLGTFRILKILGHGGMGVVYQAEDPKLKRKVAVKAMLPNVAGGKSAGQRFLREAQAMAAVEHPHIARIYHVDEDRGVAFLAMEFLKGEPLDERLKRDTKLPISEVLRIGREIAEGLAAAHGNDLIHRDIKPANIWLESPKGFVKILDFGLARAQSVDQHLTQSGMIVGTPAYMAPEQARSGKVDHRTDLFSLGIVLYRMTTGKMPFLGNDTISTLMAVSSDTPTSPRSLNAEIPAPLNDLILKLLAKNPAERFQSANETAEALAAIENERIVQTTREMIRGGVAPTTAILPASAPKATPSRRRFLPVGAVGVVLVVLAGVAATNYLLKSEVAPQPKLGPDVAINPPPPKVPDPGEIPPIPVTKDESPDRWFLRFEKNNANAVVIKGLKPESDQPLTFEAWCVPTARRSTSYLFYSEQGELSLSYYMDRWNFGFGGSSYVTADAQPDVLMHVAAVWTGRELRLFVNGSLADSKIIPDPSAMKKWTGKPPELGMGRNFFGLVRDVRISKTSRYGESFTPPHQFEADDDTDALYRCNDDGKYKILTDSSRHGRHAEVRGLVAWVKIPSDATSTLDRVKARLMSPDEEWSTPQNLGPTINSVKNDSRPSLSDDGLSLVFLSDRLGNRVGVFESRRSDVKQPFGSPVEIPLEKGLYGGPMLSADGLTLAFHVNAPLGKNEPPHVGGRDIYLMTRTSVSNLWSTPVNVGPPINGPADELDACLSPDGRTLLYTAAAPGSGTGTDIWVSRRDGTSPFQPWKAPLHLGPRVNGPGNERPIQFVANGRAVVFFRDGGLWLAYPADGKWDGGNYAAIPLPMPDVPLIDAFVTNDGDEFYFGANRPGGLGGTDLWHARRVPKNKKPETTPKSTVHPVIASLTSPEEEWTTPVNLRALNSDKNDEHASLTADGLSLLFASDRGGGTSFYEARRAVVTEPFGEPVEVSIKSDRFSGPFMSLDGLTLIYQSSVPIGKGPPHQGGTDLYQRTRPDRNSPWSDPVNLGPVINGPQDEGNACLSPDGLSLVFSSQRLGGAHKTDLWISRRKSRAANWETATPLGKRINTGQPITHVQFVAEDNAIIFRRDGAQPPGGVWLGIKLHDGDWDAVYVPAPVGGTDCNFVTNDGRELYISAGRPGGQGGTDLWLSRRVAKKK